MELKFTVKIKDEQNPPIFNEELGKGVLQTFIVNFKDVTEEDLENNPQFIRQLYEMMDKFKEVWIEVKYEKPTAVEFLAKQALNYLNDEQENNLIKVIEQALEMEKQQIVDAYKKNPQGYNYNGEKYYNETYKKEIK
jgi:hypothetical protein